MDEYQITQLLVQNANRITNVELFVSVMSEVIIESGLIDKQEFQSKLDKLTEEFTKKLDAAKDAKQSIKDDSIMYTTMYFGKEVTC